MLDLLRGVMACQFVVDLQRIKTVPHCFAFVIHDFGKKYSLVLQSLDGPAKCGCRLDRIKRHDNGRVPFNLVGVYPRPFGGWGRVPSFQITFGGGHFALYQQIDKLLLPGIQPPL